MSKNPVRVEMPDLDEEKESLANFLQKHYKLILNHNLRRINLERRRRFHL